MPNGSLLDGYDAYYGDDPNKGHRIGRGVLGGFGGTQGPGKGQSLGSNSAGGLSGGGGSYGGEGGPAASGPAGIVYGSADLSFLMGGSGGGVGNLGEAAAGGGALEIISAGELIIESGVNVSMDGGSVLVNPNQGAYFSGGAGAGGSIRLVARSIVNKGNLSAKGGHASGIDPREPGVRFLSNSGGAGGGGRVAFLYDDALEQGSVVVDGGTSNGDAKAGRSGTLFIGARSPSPLVDLNLTTGTVVFDTAGAWTHSSGIKGKGSVTRSIFSSNGRSFGYGVCRFRFNHFSLGPDASVVVRGSNSLLFDVEGNASVSTHISLDGKSGLQGVYSGLPGSGGWASGRGLRDTENNGNLHPALNGQGPGGGRGYEKTKSNGGGSYGGEGSGGFNLGIAGMVYGDEKITHLIGGSGGGHAAIGTGNSGGGGGAIGFEVTGDFALDANASISVIGGSGDADMDSSGAGGSGGSISIKAANIFNGGRLLAMGGNAFGLGGPGGGGRIALSTAGILQEGDTNASGGKSLGLSPSTHRASDLIGYWKFDENASLSVAADSSGNELNGTIGGSPQRLAGVRGGAFYFDGSDDRVFLPYDPKMALDKYSVSFWIYPERNISDSWTGLFGRAGRNYAIWLGNSNHVSSPFIHHRYAEGANTNQGPGNHNLPGWNQWYHVFVRTVESARGAHLCQRELSRG